MDWNKKYWMQNINLFFVWYIASVFDNYKSSIKKDPRNLLYGEAENLNIYATQIGIGGGPSNNFGHMKMDWIVYMLGSCF